MQSGVAFFQYFRENNKLDLPLHVLRQFQEFEKALDAKFKFYNTLPAAPAYAMRNFSILEMMAIALVQTDENKSGKKCLDHLMRLFVKDSAFEDGITLMSWFLFNFPLSHGGESVASRVLKEYPALSRELSDFVIEGNKSRLGLYEMMRHDKNGCMVKELFTGKEYNLPGHPPVTPIGNILVVRIMNFLGDWYIFGDTNEFPADRKKEIMDMAFNKMSLYYPDSNPTVSYDSYMRLSGPYWFSIVARDYDGDVINADYYLRYYCD
jgi:hypothetical protein